MRKAINISIIVLFLIAICTVEQILAQTYLNGVQNRIEDISYEYLASAEINTTKLISKTNELESYWTEKESVLCNFVNHKDIEDIGIEINKMQNAIKENSREQFAQSIDLIKFYLKGYQHVIGISIQNIF